MATLNDIQANLSTTGKPVEGGCAYTAFTTPKAFPTDATTKMSTLTEFVSLGELSQNGYTESRSISSTNHKGWHGTTVITSIDDETNTYSAEFIEPARPAVAKLRYGDAGVTENEDGSVKEIKVKPFDGKPHPLVFDELEDNGYLRRTVVKKAVITSFDDTPHQKGALLVYKMTFTVNEPDDGSEAIVIYRAKPSDA